VFTFWRNKFFNPKIRFSLIFIYSQKWVKDRQVIKYVYIVENVPIVITAFGEISKKIKRKVTWAFEEASFEIEVLSFDRKMS